MAQNNQSPGALRGVTPLAYAGTTPNMVFNTRRPTTRDVFNFVLGTWWIIPQSTNGAVISEEVWILVGNAQNTATWIRLQSSGSPVNNNIIITEYNTPGETGTHTLNDQTVIVEVMGWGGGAGAGSFAVADGGGFGGMGSPFSQFKTLAVCLGGAGANVSYSVALGGSGTTTTDLYLLGNPSIFGNLYLNGPDSTNTSQFLYSSLGNYSNSGIWHEGDSFSGSVVLSPAVFPGFVASSSGIPILNTNGAVGNVGTSSAAAGGTALGNIYTPPGPGAPITDNFGNVILAGGTAGIEGGNPDGGNGLDYNGTYFAGGSGGGSGVMGGGAFTAGNGGNGGWPGGGGGCGGGDGKKGGDGGGGRLIVIEYLQ